MSRPAPVASDWLESQIGEQHRKHLRGHGGEISPLYRALGNSPTMLEAWLGMAWSLRLDATSPRALRELAIVLVGKRWAAPFELAAHIPMAIDAGCSKEQVDSLTEWGRRPDLYEETERAVLSLADAMITNTVEDHHMIAVESLLGKEQTIEIVLTIGFYQMVSSVTKALGLDPADRS